MYYEGEENESGSGKIFKKGKRLGVGEGAREGIFEIK